MVEDRWFQKVVCVKESCVSANGLCVKELRERTLCVKESCEKVARESVVCVRKLACFFPRWVKVGLPSDAVGRSAITRMRTDRPMLLCVQGASAHRPCCLGYEPGLRAKHTSPRHPAPQATEVTGDNISTWLAQGHAPWHETKERRVLKQHTADACTTAWKQAMPVLLPKVNLDTHLSYQCMLRSGDLGPTSVWTSVRYWARRGGTTSTRHDHRRDLSWWAGSTPRWVQ